MKKAKKHILKISPFASPNIGGVESHLDKLVSEAVAKGFYITLITYMPLTTAAAWDKYIKKKNYQIFRVPWFGVGLFPKLEKFFPLAFAYLFPGLFFKSLVFYVRNHKEIDCIHVHGLASAVIARILVKIHKKKIILSTHAIYSFYERPILNFFVKKVLSGFDHILCVSDVSRKEIIKMGIPKNKTSVHKNWVDVETFMPQKEKPYKTWSNKLNVLFVGRFLENKGVNILCEVAKKLPNINFHFVGTGPLSKRIKKQSSELSNVIYHGALRQSNKKEFKKLLRLYSHCDYFVSPYLYDEGFSATLIESVCCGAPVVVPKRGSPPTFLDKSVAYFMPAKISVDVVYKKLKSLPKKTEKIKKTCRSFAVTNFSSENAQTILKHYE